MIRRDHWGRGIALEAVRALVAWAFRELALHRMWADVDPENEASIRLAERLGMRREAHLRKNVWIKGGWRDTVLLAILDEEWRE